MPHRESKIEYHQVIRKDGSVHSHQWMTLPVGCVSELAVEDIVGRYLSYLRIFTWGLVRPRFTAAGIALRFLGLPLICFALPVTTRTEITANADLFINGGLLVQRESSRRGQLRFTLIEAPGQSRIEIRLSDYYPLLLGTRNPTRFRKWLYHVSQASIHTVVTLHFLARLSSDLSGLRSPLNAVRTTLADGEEI